MYQKNVLRNNGIIEIKHLSGNKIKFFKLNIKI